MNMLSDEYEEKTRRLKADAEDARKAYVRARSLYEGICDELRNLRINWNEQQKGRVE